VSAGLDAIKAAIRAELILDGATQADLARYLGVTQKHVSRVLNGHNAGSPAFIEEILHAVGLSWAAVLR
jgi:transcriptional regulator with XRE-family HTH domain